jgi:hypothetical protein
MLLATAQLQRFTQMSTCIWTMWVCIVFSEMFSSIFCSYRMSISFSYACNSFQLFWLHFHHLQPCGRHDRGLSGKAVKLNTIPVEDVRRSGNLPKRPTTMYGSEDSEDDVTEPDCKTESRVSSDVSLQIMM